jgi:hypothetical protein
MPVPAKIARMSLGRGLEGEETVAAGRRFFHIPLT